MEFGAGCAEAALAREGDPFTGGERFVAVGASETFLVVGLAQGCDDLTLDKLVAGEAGGAEV